MVRIEIRNSIHNLEIFQFHSHALHLNSNKNSYFIFNIDCLRSIKDFYRANSVKTDF